MEEFQRIKQLKGSVIVGIVVNQ